MLITFFDSRGIIHREFVPTGQTITGAYYLEVLKRLMARIRRIRSEYRDTETWSLLHSFFVNFFSLFSLSPKLKLKLRGCFFNDISTIKTATTRELEAIPQNELEHAFESLLNRCYKCIETGGKYFG